jgi:hypothetical protein
MIDVVVSSGTDTVMKTRLLAALVETTLPALIPTISWCSSKRSIAPIAPSAAVGLRHQSQVSNHSTVAAAATTSMLFLSDRP